VTRSPGASHPIIRTHPESGRPVLFLGRRRNAYVDGLPLADSEALLDTLWSHATDPAFTWHHHWRAGDLLLWDNRAVLHRRDPFDESARRIMHRTQIKGTAVV
jgi:taurine dioxygenase